MRQLALFQYAWWRLDDLEVKVLYRPGKGNEWPNVKGVHREVESEESRRQSTGLTNRNPIGGARSG